MKTLSFVALAAALSFIPAGSSSATVDLRPALQAETVQHGGGCRKSSPAGMCCHMDRRAGVVHCH